MRYYRGELYIEFKEMVDAGVSRNTLLGAKSRKSKKWKFKKSPQDRRKVLIHYESISQKYKELVLKKYGDPYKFIQQIESKQFHKQVMRVNAEKNLTITITVEVS